MSESSIQGQHNQNNDDIARDDSTKADSSWSFLLLTLKQQCLWFDFSHEVLLLKENKQKLSLSKQRQIISDLQDLDKLMIDQSYTNRYPHEMTIIKQFMKLKKLESISVLQRKDIICNWKN